MDLYSEDRSIHFLLIMEIWTQTTDFDLAFLKTADEFPRNVQVVYNSNNFRFIFINSWGTR
jgi:hypothetical protein